MSGPPKLTPGPAENSGAFSLCDVCQGDGWIAYPTWADSTKQTVCITKVACPRGCPLANPDEKGVQATYPEHERGL